MNDLIMNVSPNDGDSLVDGVVGYTTWSKETSIVPSTELPLWVNGIGSAWGLSIETTLDVTMVVKIIMGGGEEAFELSMDAIFVGGWDGEGGGGRWWSTPMGYIDDQSSSIEVI